MKRTLRNNRAQALAEIIVILIILGFVVLISTRIIKKSLTSPVENDPKKTGVEAPASTPGAIIKDAKESLEKSTNRPIPEGLQDETESRDQTDGEDE